jgi:tetratricopeptide (TPR) repeat protein
MFEGSKKKVELSNEIKYELDYALKLNPDDDVAYSILGSFYRALGNVSWFERTLADLFLGGLPEGGYEESEKALTRAIELAPENMRHHYELARLYLNWDRQGEARRSFERAVTCPVLVARDRSRQTRAKRWARSLAGEE